MTTEEIKGYVVNRSSVNKPRCYKGHWNVMLTLGSDINEHAPIIEMAYKKMTETIQNSEYLQKFIRLC